MKNSNNMLSQSIEKNKLLEMYSFWKQELSGNTVQNEDKNDNLESDCNGCGCDWSC